MHKQALAFLQAHAAQRPEGLVIDLGGRNVNGSPRDLFGDPYLAVDLCDGSGVDLIADAATYQPLSIAACVICAEVLEHTPQAEEICANAWKMLEPGGVFLITAAGVDRPPHSAIDGKALRPGEFYRGVSIQQLQAWLEPFTRITIQTDPGVFKQPNGDIYARAVK